MARAITDEAFGAWLLKCNPKFWDLPRYRAREGQRIYDWAVQDNYRSKRMQPGDPVVFWVTGADGSSLEPGIWGLGEVTTQVDVKGYRADTSGDGSQPKEDYWLDPVAKARARYFIGLDVRLLGQPVTRAAVRAVAALAGAEVFRSPMMGNPNWLTRAEWRALQPLLPENRRPSSQSH